FLKFSSEMSNSISSDENFHRLLLELITIPTPPSGDTSTVLRGIIQTQIKKTETILKRFLNNDVLLSIGNPSRFSRGVFNRFIRTQNQYFPYIVNSVPTASGSITLAG